MCMCIFVCVFMLFSTCMHACVCKYVCLIYACESKIQLDILNTFTVGHTQHIYSWTYSTHLQLDILNTFTVGHTQHIYSYLV